MASLPDPKPTVILPRAVPAEQASLAALLQYEGEIRRQESVNELVYFIANETRRIIAYDQMFVLRQAMAGDGFHIVGASSLAVIDRNAPLVQGIERAISAMMAEHGQADACDFAADAWSDDASVLDYPFPHWRWEPLRDRSGKAFAGLLFARAEPYREAERVRTGRVAGTAAHAWLALSGGKPVRRLPKLDRRKKQLGLIALAIAAVFPVRLTALAPVEVVAARPFVVSAPYAGVIASMIVPPNSMVKAGQPVLAFEDIKVRNEVEQAREKVSVARARLERATSASFADKDQGREIATLRAELELAEADYAYARDVMSKSQIAAPRDGMVIYSDRRDWEGRAVNTGDPILQIADPSAIAYRADLPAKEQMTLAPGSSMKVWLDGQPLWAHESEVEYASYQARMTPDNVLAFAVTARPLGEPPRIGSRGTAKLYGQWVPLSYSLLRRPLTAARQFIGL